MGSFLTGEVDREESGDIRLASLCTECICSNAFKQMQLVSIRGRKNWDHLEIGLRARDKCQTTSVLQNSNWGCFHFTSRSLLSCSTEYFKFVHFSTSLIK